MNKYGYMSNNRALHFTHNPKKHQSAFILLEEDSNDDDNGICFSFDIIENEFDAIHMSLFEFDEYLEQCGFKSYYSNVPQIFYTWKYLWNEYHIHKNIN
jgi:hypothetical protein